jgi:hypothetical protein
LAKAKDCLACLNSLAAYSVLATPPLQAHAVCQRRHLHRPAGRQTPKAVCPVQGCWKTTGRAPLLVDDRCRCERCCVLRSHVRAGHVLVDLCSKAQQLTQREAGRGYCPSSSALMPLGACACWLGATGRPNQGCAPSCCPHAAAPHAAAHPHAAPTLPPHMLLRTLMLPPRCRPTCCCCAPCTRGVPCCGARGGPGTCDPPGCWTAAGHQTVRRARVHASTSPSPSGVGRWAAGSAVLELSHGVTCMPAHAQAARPPLPSLFLQSPAHLAHKLVLGGDVRGLQVGLDHPLDAMPATSTAERSSGRWARGMPLHGPCWRGGQGSCFPAGLLWAAGRACWGAGAHSNWRLKTPSLPDLT